MGSEKYKEAISSSIRETKAEIQFDFIDTEARENAVPTFSPQVVFSNGNQILNNNKNKSIKVATLEKNFWKLDSSYMNLGYKNISNEEIGFISDVISKEDCTFENSPTIVFDFSSTHSSIGLTLFFDDLTNNYARKMKIRFLNNDTVLNDKTIENDQIRFIYSNKVENYNKIEITFLETSLPYRRIRLVDIIFGIIQIYEDKQIVNCSLAREFNPFNDNIPSHELSFEIDNIDKSFNLINPTGLYAYLQKRQQVTLRIGVVLEDKTTEFVEMGKYYLNEWEAKNLTFTLKAQDILTFLEEVTYSNSVTQSKTLSEFAIEILSSAGITEYVLDDSLNSINCSTSISETSIKELLKQIAIAGNCVLFTDKNNKINIVKLNAILSNNITLDNMYETPNIVLDELVNRIKVTYFINGTSNDLVILSPTDIEGKEKTVSSIFINSAERAQSIGNYLLNLYQNRRKYKINWRQDLEIDINQKVNVEDDFNENDDVIITKQEFKYSGYLSGNTEGRIT